MIELLSIEKGEDQSFLRINLLFGHEQELELLWMIDDETARALQQVTDFNEKNKYRLSFHHSWDLNKNKYSSTLTRTYLDQSDRISFTCSEEYIKSLHSLKQLQQVSELSELPFTLSQSTEKKVEEENEKLKIKVQPSRSPIQFSWVAIAMISIISIILLGYSNHTIIKEALFGQENLAQAKSITLDPSQELTRKEVNVQLPHHVPVVTNEPEPKSEQKPEPTIPMIELQDTVSYSIPKGYVALTFDDGPSIYSNQIVDILNQYKVGGTFFFIGQHVNKYPEKAQYVHENGFSIGSHSINHVNFTDLSYEDQEIELIQSIQYIENVIDDKVVLFRPPFGAKNEGTIELMKRTDSKMVLWNKDTEDWKHRNSDAIFNYVQGSEASGAIILLHESKAVIDALPRIIEYLQDQGLQIVGLR